MMERLTFGCALVAIAQAKIIPGFRGIPTTVMSNIDHEVAVSVPVTSTYIDHTTDATNGLLFT